MTIRIIGAAMGHGAKDPSSQEAPDFLRRNKITDFLQSVSQIESSWESIIYPHFQTISNNSINKIPLVSEFCQRLEKTVNKVYSNNEQALVIGGDHSCAVGTWSAVARNLRQKKGERLGLMWIDAHLDSHTFETSPSKAIHGMPLACLLGRGESSLVNCGSAGAKIKSENCVIIGARSYEDGEKKLLDDLGVKIFEMPEIKQKGYSRVFEEAYQTVSKNNSQNFGISIDMDAFDPQEVPAVGTPEKNGLKVKKVVDCLNQMDKSKLCGVEIAEYSPLNDIDMKGLIAIKKILAAIYGR